MINDVYRVFLLSMGMCILLGVLLGVIPGLLLSILAVCIYKPRWYMYTILGSVQGVGILTILALLTH